MSGRTGMRGMSKTLVPVGFGVTAALVGVSLLLVLLSRSDEVNATAPDYLPLAYAATAVLIAVFAVGALVRRTNISFGRLMPWVVGLLSATVSLVPWWLVWTKKDEVGQLIYGGLKVPLGPAGSVQFRDLALSLKSIDCASFGFDVYAANSGCLKDPSIYGPGVLWLRWIPFDLFSERYATGIGIVMILASSSVLLWLCRNSVGLGQVVLLVSAVGGPWLLLLERGNLDALLLWTAVAAVILVRRWPGMWAWWVAAALIWLMGTWKYYPFAMGVLLIPVLRLRRGWTVITGFVLATALFLAMTWDNFRFSQDSNTGMIDVRDVAVLGRAPVVFRMIGTEWGTHSLYWGDLVIALLGIAAVGWGVLVAGSLGRRLTHPAMLGAAGSALFLASVLVAGFGFAYKATFLLLGVPLVAELNRSSRSAIVSSSVTVLALVGVCAVVVWNTVLATLAGVTAAGFILGLSCTLLCKGVYAERRVTVT